MDEHENHTAGANPDVQLMIAMVLAAILFLVHTLVLA